MGEVARRPGTAGGAGRGEVARRPGQALPDYTPAQKSGLWSEAKTIGRMMKAAPAGIASMTREVAVDTTAPFRFAYDTILGGGVRRTAAEDPVSPGSALQHYVPFLNQTGSSLRRTYDRVEPFATVYANPGNIAKNETRDKLANHPYRTAYNEGRLSADLIEDVGNIAIVTGIGAAGGRLASGAASRSAAAATRRAATAAAAGDTTAAAAAASKATKATARAESMAQMQQGLRKVARFGDLAAGGATMPYLYAAGPLLRTPAAKAAGRAVARGVDTKAPRVADAVRTGTGKVSAMAAAQRERWNQNERMARINQEGQWGAATDADAFNAYFSEARELLAEPTGRRGKRAKPNPDAELAAMELNSQASKTLLHAFDAQPDLPADTRWQLIEEAYKVDDTSTMTPEAWALIEGVHRNTLDAAATTKLRDASELIGKAYAARDGIYSSGFGATDEVSPSGLLDRSANTAESPNPVAVNKAVQEVQARLDAQTKVLAEALAAADAANNRRILTPEQYRTRASKQIPQMLRQARHVAARVVREDPVRAREAAGFPQMALPETAGQPYRPDVTDKQLTDALASKLVGGGSSSNATLAALHAELVASGRLADLNLGMVDPSRKMTPVRQAAQRSGVSAEADRFAANLAASGERATSALERRAFAEGPAAAPTPRPAWQGGPTLFHGSSTPITGRLGPRRAPSDSVRAMGPGFYTTPDAKVAGQYTAKGDGGQAVVHNVEWAGEQPPKLLDLEGAAPEEMRAIARAIADTYQDPLYTRTFRSMADDPRTTTFDLIKRARENAFVETTDPAVVYQALDLFAEAAVALGYDAYTYNGPARAQGGPLRPGEPTHLVHIFLTPENLRVTANPPPAAAGGRITGPLADRAAAALAAARSRAVVPDAPASATKPLEQALRAERVTTTRAGKASGAAAQARQRIAGRAAAAAAKSAGKTQLTLDQVSAVGERLTGTEVAKVERMVLDARKAVRGTLDETITDLSGQIEQVASQAPYRVPKQRGTAEWDLYSELREALGANAVVGRTRTRLFMGQAAARKIEAAGGVVAGIDNLLDSINASYPAGVKHEGVASPVDNFIATAHTLKAAKTQKARALSDGVDPALADDPVTANLLEGTTREAADRLVGEFARLTRPFHDPAVVAEVRATYDALADARQAGTDFPDTFWKEVLEEVMDPEDVATLALLTPEGAWQSTLETKIGLGHRLEVDAPAVVTPAAAARQATSKADQNATLAWLADAQARRAGDTARAGRQRLSADEKPLYDAHEARNRRATATRRVPEARERLTGSLLTRGHTAGYGQGEKLGRAAGKAETLNREAAKAAGRADRVGTARPDAYEAQVAGVAGVAGRMVDTARKTGKLEERARVAQRAADRELRATARLTAERAAAGPKAAASPEAIPTRYKAASRAAGEVAARADQLADQLEAKAQARAAALGDDPAGAPEGAWDAVTADLVAARQLRDLAESMPSSLADLQAIGVAAPEFRFGSRSKSGGGAWQGNLADIRKGSAQRQSSRTRGTSDMTLHGQAKAAALDSRRNWQNETAHAVAAEFGTTAAKEGYGHLTGADLAKAMSDKGYGAWNPKAMLVRVDAKAVTPETMFLPEHILNNFEKTWGPKARWVQNVEKYYDRAFLGNVKMGWLAFSPKWLVGNAVGNTLMGMADVGIYDYLAALPEAIRMVREDSKPINSALDDPYANRTPVEFLGAGFAATEKLRVPSDTLRSGAGARIHKTADRMYGLNELTDNISRNAVYLARMKNGASPEVAVRSALAAVGDFQRLTPLERNALKRVWVFYPWYRHITKLTLQMPFRHPHRVAWWLHLGELFGPSEEEAPSFLAGMIPGGGGAFFQLGGLNPFQPTEELPFASPANAATNVTPAFQWPAAIILGLDWRAGGDPLSRPAGSGSEGFMGAEKTTPLWNDPRGMAWYLGQQFPQVRTATNILADPVVRDDTGRQINWEDGPRPSPRYSRLDEAAGFFGVPYRRRYDPAAITATIEANRKKAADARARDAERRAVYGG
jgi:hypothetical protein